ncbi:MAG: uroporphyrinogen-III synthase [Pseudomonadales bacterium]|nr:uroporphyrinogen-III synthase [Pseudomonadales bacterium]
MTYQVILTRLFEQNADFQSQLNLPDVNVVSKPLLTYCPISIEGTAAQRVIDLNLYDALIFISQNAVRYGLPHLQSYWPQWPHSLLWFAVGPATRRLMETEDIKVYSPKLASSEGLLELSELRDAQIQKVLIVRGLGGRETLREGLVARGVKVDYLEVYQRKGRVYDGNFNGRHPGKFITLIYSGEALSRLRQLVGETVGRYRLIVPSKRLQTMAFDKGFDKVELAGSQNDSAMLAVLRKCLARYKE